MCDLSIVNEWYLISDNIKFPNDDKIKNNSHLLNQINSGPLYDGDIFQLNTSLKSFLSDPEIVSIQLQESQGNIPIHNQAHRRQVGGLHQYCVVFIPHPRRHLVIGSLPPAETDHKTNSGTDRFIQ